MVYKEREQRFEKDILYNSGFSEITETIWNNTGIITYLDFRNITVLDLHNAAEDFDNAIKTQI